MKRSFFMPVLLLALLVLAGCADEPKIPGVDLKITSFVFQSSQNSGLVEDAPGVINHENGTISVRVNGGNLSSMIPTVTYSGGTLSPEGAQDFSSPVFYRVLSADGLSSMGYVVSVELYGDSFDVANGIKTVAVQYAAGERASAVSNNVTLMSSTTNGCAVGWTTADATLVTTNGVVNRPAYLSNDRSVTLTATVSKGSASQSTNFVLVIKRLPATDAEKVFVDARDVTVGYASGDSAASVTQNLILTNAGPVFGTAISWSTTAGAVIGTDGTVNRPAFSPNGDTNVTLTAVAEANGIKATNSTFVLTVKQLDDPAIAEVTNAAALLAISYAAGESAAAVSNNVSLPLSGADGTTVTWDSDAPGIIATDGTVTRPAFGSGNATVSLTATVSKSSFPGQTPVRSEIVGFTLTVIEQEPSDAQKAAADAAALSIVYTGSDSAAAVTANLGLTNLGSVYGSAIAWSSSAVAVIGTDGTVNRPAYSPAGDTNVVLTAAVTMNAASTNRDFTVTVKQLEDPAISQVSNAAYNLVITYAAGESAAAVSNNLTLPATGSDGTTVSWSSQTPGVIATDGTVTRPAYGSGNATVQLTAVISKSSFPGETPVRAVTNTFSLTVIQQEPSDTQAVAETLANLAIVYGSGDSASSVTQNLTLTNAGPWGVTVGWSSDKTAFVADNGTVTRPTWTEGEQTVTLTATATKNAASDTTNFVLTLPALPPSTDLEKITAESNALAIGYASGDSATNVTQNLTLQTIGTYSGVGITWASSHTNVDPATGNVIRPAIGDPDVTVTLTATLTNATQTLTKEFTVTVIATPNTVTYIETCDNMTTGSSSYLTPSWTGVGGIAWSATLARTDQTLDGPAVCSKGEVTAVYPNGIQRLKFSHKHPYSESNPAVEVYVNGVKYGSSIPVTSSVATTDWITIGVSGSATLVFKTGGARISFDNITVDTTP